MRIRTSVRLWQTELFIVVIVVAILILSASLSQGLQRTLRSLGEGTQLRNASALASSLSPEFPLTVESLQRVRAKVSDFQSIYGENVWVYDVDGTVIDSAIQGRSPKASQLEDARLQGLADSPPYSEMTLKEGGFTVAGKAVYDPDERRAGSVVVAEPVTTSLAVLDAVRSRLWVTFWVALTVAGLLGFTFSEFIGRRVRRMSVAAAAIAAGDFDQRLPVGLVPDEVSELAESYNQMAITLGETFSVLREREQDLASLVESMAEGVIDIGADGVVRVANPEAVMLLDRQDDVLVGREIAALTDDARVLDLVANGLQGRSVSTTTLLGERIVLAHCTPVITDDGVSHGAVLLLSDITEQRRAEEAQRRFVANASHEMRTPIAALKGLLELLVGGAQENPEVRDDFLRTMQLEVDRLGRLVTDLLTLAQLESGGLKLRSEEASTAEMLEQVASVLRPLAESAGVTMTVALPDGDPLVSCDRDRVVQVLIALADNGLKHSERGDTVTLKATRERGRATLSVSDEGAGVPPEAIPRLFDRFYRADESRAAPGGAGLGLSIAKEIVEAHGSTISVESSPGAGSTFGFELPLSGRG